MRNLLKLLVFILILGCAKKEQVDLIITNANIYTVNDNFESTEAIAVSKGKIVGIGSTSEIISKFESDNRKDVEGKTILPGFIDAHCHFLWMGLNENEVNLVGTKSFEDVVKRVILFQNERKVDFIKGHGWDQNDWEDKSFPNKNLLDKLFPNTPIALTRVDGHAMLCNQAALDLADISINTPFEGGDILNKGDQLTGILIDNPMLWIEAKFPKPTLAQQKRALLDAQKICFDYGLTTVDDAGLDKEEIELIQEMHESGELKMRIYAMISNTNENLDYFLNKGKIKTDKLNVQSVKVFADGALGSRGATLKEPYSDEHDHFGAMLVGAPEYKKLAERIAKSDYQMNTHAIGDSANRVVLQTYKSVLKGKTNRRWRVEHAQVITDNDFDYFEEDNIIPSIQPTHATSDMYWAEDRLGKDRIKGAYAYQELLRKSGRLALGTDFPVEQVNPFLTFYAAVSRQDVKGFPKNGFQNKDALSREEALKGMTIWAAHANFEEHEKGSLEVGKFADFIVLDQDIMTVEVSKIPGIKVLGTFVDGKQVN